ncbi:hypothetical protein Pse7367_1468 [Thalassoporum mexicanum PCC 7367]|uniref:hypothetical protein n=1 Tax=Thalassoporum mexicanum TaxID=3457544 RepID=UPI00029F8FF9|nr:hypothetical protein [Pseudanabaena sp. PCC 7367]AFY69759.1 hypothetical protein Pse7367_1468 [Pseudanabaena sp. PCC 7367]
MEALLEQGGVVLIIAGLIIIAILSLLVALILQLSMQMALGAKPTYGNAYVTTFVAYLVVGTVQSAFRAITGNPLDSELGLPPREWLVLTLISYVTQSLIYGLLLKYPESGAIGFGKGMFVSLIQTVLVVVITIAILFAVLILVFIATLIFGGG